MKSYKSNFFIPVLSAILLISSVVTPALVRGQQAPSASNPQNSTRPAAVPSMAPGLDSKTGLPLYETIQEDWSSLLIGTSKLQPETPVAGQVEEQDNFTRSLVQVQWRPGDPIDLWVVVPKGVKKPPAVLYIYNYDQDTDRFRDNGWCRRATAGGVAAIGFVSALSGHRFHDRPMRQWFISELQESVGSTVHDVKFILDYLAQRGDIDMDRIGIFGEQSGGAIAILAAAADSRIKAVDTLEPWGDWPVFLAKSPVVKIDPEHRNFATPAFLKKVANLDPVKWLPELKTPIRIQQIREVEATPAEVKDRIQSAAPKQAEVARYVGAMDLARRQGQGRMFEWIKTKLAQPEGNSKVSVAAKENVRPKSGNRPAQR